MTAASYSLTTEHAHLLRAALCPPDEALAHWQAWRKIRNLHIASPAAESVKRAFTLLDASAQQLLPMICRNLEQSDDALMGHLQQAYETTLRDNQRRLSVMSTVLNALRQANVSSLLLGSLPLSLLHYGDVGMRTMDKLALLIPTEKADTALAVLHQQQFLPSAYGFRHRRQLDSLPLTRPDGLSIRLHWHTLPQHTYVGADEPFWADAQLLELPTGLPALTLSPTHLLFQTLVIGYQGGRRTALPSLPDSMQLIRTGQIVWDELLDLTERFTFRIPVRRGLMALQTRVDLVLPPAVQQRLRQMVPTVAEQRYFDLLSSIPKNPLSQRFQRLRCSQMALRLFHQNGSRESLRTVVWHHMNPRLAWPDAEWPR
ncbi:nucleotidyltransferase family protein [Fibrella sp. WM1]|uniref:nucleotidyltransferase family protein n=1 Tax=Fibrella musci TaxID=3242485 RepID=UPI003522E702